MFWWGSQSWLPPVFSRGGSLIAVGFQPAWVRRCRLKGGCRQDCLPTKVASPLLSKAEKTSRSIQYPEFIANSIGNSKRSKWRPMWMTATASAVIVCIAAFAAVWNLASPDHTSLGARPADVPLRDIEFTSHGATLRGWFVRPDQHRGVVVLMHGIRANRAQMVGRARFLHHAGYSSLLCDSRAQGESGGDAITFGHLESEDARAEVALARSLAPGEPIAVIGVSLGGAAVLLANPPLDVDAMVLESVYPSIDRAIENRLRGAIGGVAAPLLAPGFTHVMMAMIRPRLGFGANELRPIDHAGLLRTPKFFLFGTADRDTTFSESMEMFNAAAEPKQMWAVEGAGHVDLHDYERREYERRVLEFLGRNLKR